MLCEFSVSFGLDYPVMLPECAFVLLVACARPSGDNLSISVFVTAENVVVIFSM